MRDPLVLDVDIDGIELTTLSQSHAYFDLNASGFAQRTAWVTGGDGLLARDINNDGRINDITELFGNATTDGFTALTALDGNADNTITAADAAWNDLRVWVDADADGNTDAGELKTLAELNITEISLNDTATSQTINGNAITHTATFKMNGTDKAIVNANLQTETHNTIYNGPLATLDWEALAMPALRGYGTVADLGIAMSLDPALKTAFATLTASATLSTFGTFAANVESFLHAWAGPARAARRVRAWRAQSNSQHARHIYMSRRDSGAAI